MSDFENFYFIDYNYNSLYLIEFLSLLIQNQKTCLLKQATLIINL